MMGLTFTGCGRIVYESSPCISQLSIFKNRSRFPEKLKYTLLRKSESPTTIIRGLPFTSDSMSRGAAATASTKGPRLSRLGSYCGGRPCISNSAQLLLLVCPREIRPVVGDLRSRNKGLASGDNVGD